MIEGSLTIETDAISGGIDPTPLPTDAVVALLYDSALAFGTPKAGDITALTLTVTSRQRLGPGTAPTLQVLYQNLRSKPVAMPGPG